jgi:hypothetical protein
MARVVTGHFTSLGSSPHQVALLCCRLCYGCASGWCWLRVGFVPMLSHMMVHARGCNSPVHLCQCGAMWCVRCWCSATLARAQQGQGAAVRTHLGSVDLARARCSCGETPCVNWGLKGFYCACGVTCGANDDNTSRVGMCMASAVRYCLRCLMLATLLWSHGMHTCTCMQLRTKPQGSSCILSRLV